MTFSLRLLALLSFMFLALTGAAPSAAHGSAPTQQINDEMEKLIAPLQTVAGWKAEVSAHPEFFDDLSQSHSGSFLAVAPHSFKINGDEYIIGVGYRSLYIAASPKTVVDIVNNPKFFQTMYGLDKPADISPIEPDGSFKAHVFKLVPGIETQDYTLEYTGHWESDGAWLGQARQLDDAKGFALRNNIEIVKPSGAGTIYREVALLYPMRWWVRLFHGLAQNIFKSELGKLNKSLACVCEKVQAGAIMSDDLGKTCYKAAQK